MKKYLPKYEIVVLRGDQLPVQIGTVIDSPQSGLTLTVTGMEHQLHKPGKDFVLNAVLRLEDEEQNAYYAQWMVNNQVDIRFNNSIYQTTERGEFYYEGLKHRHLPPMPSAEQIANLQVGDLAPHSHGEGKVTEIISRKSANETADGKAYVRYRCGDKEGLLKEGEHFKPEEWVILKSCSWTPHYAASLRKAQSK